MEIIHKMVEDLTPLEYQACYRANYGKDGYMRGELQDCRNAGLWGQTILLWDGPGDRISSLIGWAMLRPARLSWVPNIQVKKQPKYSAQFWVKKQYRRQGYGKLLMQEVKKLDSRPLVMPHDTASSELFSSFNVTVLESDKHMIRRKPRIA